MNQPPLRQFNQPEKKAPWWTRLRPSAVITIALVLLLLTLSFVVGTVVFAKKPTALFQVGQAATPGKNVVQVTPTIIPHPSGQWVTVQTFSGKGSKKTTLFTVPSNWRIAWSCDPTSHSNTNYYLFVRATTATNTLLDNSVETTCSQNNTQNSSQLHQGGKVYLSILSQGSWIVQVQALK